MSFFRLRGSKLNKIIDFYFGIPLVFLLAVVTRSMRRSIGQSDFSKSVRILAVQFGALGDSILCASALKSLQEEGHEVTVLCAKANEAIFRHMGFEIIIIDLAKILLRPWSLFQIVKEIRRRDFYWIVDFFQWPRLSAILCIFFRTSSARTIGFETANQFRSWGYNIKVRHRSDRHELANYFALIQPIKNLVVKPHLMDISLLDHHLSAVQNKLNLRPNEKFIVLHPWAGGYRARDKEWKTENYFNLPNTISDDCRILITGHGVHSDDLEKFKGRDKFIIAANKLSLDELLVVLKHSQFVISVNTGVLHLAASLGCNIIALNGPTNYLRWGPVSYLPNQRLINLNASAPCSPCLNLGFEYQCKKMFCMPTITQEMFEAEIEKINL